MDEGRPMRKNEKKTNIFVTLMSLLVYLVYQIIRMRVRAFIYMGGLFLEMSFLDDELKFKKKFSTFAAEIE